MRRNRRSRRKDRSSLEKSSESLTSLKSRAREKNLMGYSQLSHSKLLEYIKHPIPQKVHQIWIGEAPLPEYYHLFKKSFEKYLPYEYKLWRQEDVTEANFPLTFKYIKKSNIYAQVSDLMRYEIIHRHGGYYFDLSFEIMKDMTELFHNISETFIICNEDNYTDDYISNGFFASIPKHPFLKQILSKEVLDNIDFTNTQINMETGPWFFRSHLKLNQVELLSTEYIYPCGYNCKDNCTLIRKPKNMEDIYEIKVKFKTIYLRYPCKAYPRSYANKHFCLGGSWL